MPGILRFVSILFSIFEKGDEEKNCSWYFEICKYSFSIFEKGNKQKLVPGVSRFVGRLF